MPPTATAAPVALTVTAKSSACLDPFHDVVDYRDDAIALMPLDEEPVRITEIELRPTITVSGEVNEERIHKLVDTAHRHCFVSNSLTAQMTITPTVEVST